MVPAAEAEAPVAAKRLFGIFSPKPGVWSEYAIFDRATGRRTVIRMSIVGVEQDSYWYEVGYREDTGTRIVKIMVKGDPIYPENIQRLIIKSGPAPAQEVGGEFAFMGVQEAGSIFEQQSGIPARSTPDLKSVKTGTGTATVVAGTFDVSLHEIVDRAGKVYARYKFSQEVRPFGIVSSDTDTTTMVLVGHGTGARSLITEEPGLMTQPPGEGQPGIIMQIPGMGTGYESKQ
jgi:hypothetical protein